MVLVVRVAVQRMIVVAFAVLAWYVVVGEELL